MFPELALLAYEADPFDSHTRLHDCSLYSFFVQFHAEL